MLSALICVFFALLTKGDNVTGDAFRPTPIPLDEWRPYESRGRAGTLQETIKTASPATVVAIPAHYWEDALRHSVYLTLVRDKIDQLIAKGDIIEPDYKHNSHVSKEVDDQDLWDKIKAAPFDRIKENDPTTYGDVTILAQGRLMEESRGFRFTEDDKSNKKCDDEKCMDGVKAFWSVKRVRQRDQEISPGKYHYELTFSVLSQIPTKQKKTYEHPIRTFTVQESTKDRVTDSPRTYRVAEKSTPQISRPERAIWFHKNIAPTPRYKKRQHYNDFDRLLSSLFDYDNDEPNYGAPRKFKQSYQPSFLQHSKIGYVGSSSSEQVTQMKSLPYPYIPQNFKYQSYPITTSSIGLIQQYSFEHEIDGINNPHITQADYMPAGFHIQKSTHSPVLPTPLPSLVPTLKESYVKKSSTLKHDILENITNISEIAPNLKQYNKIKTPGKLNYFPEHLRPPIYNAPPGVFVTMDKKPFKPMPPLKMPATKPLKTNRPIDFRPSPQVLDVQFSEPDPLFDSVFRPITVNYAEIVNSTERILISKENDKVENKIQKPNSNVKNPLNKKQQYEKTYQTTTNTPEIITAHNTSEEEDVMDWADILGVFAKTTPMQSQKSKNIIFQTTTPLTGPQPITTLTIVSTQIASDTPSTTTMSTTLKPKNRTRPPPKFNKTEKIKKHKRVSTTTSTTTTTEILLPTKYAGEFKTKKTNQDLIPQASTTAANTTKIPWKLSTTSTSTTPSSTTSTSKTTNFTSTTKITSTTKKPIESETMSSISRSKSTNRFRQSTLMTKGTSLKHDRWSITSPAPEKLRPSIISTPIQTHRRKGSNFHGYVSSTPNNLDEELKRHDHIDHGIVKSTDQKTETKTKDIEMLSRISTDLAKAGETSMDNQDEVTISELKNNETYEESRDHNEYIFQNISDTDNDKGNEVIDADEVLTTEKIVTTSSLTISKNKKCKKKHQNLSSKDNIHNPLEKNESISSIIPITTTTTLATPSMLENLLNDFSFADLEQSQTTTTKINLDKEPLEPHKQYTNDELEELLDSLSNENQYEDLSDVEYENDDDDDDEDDDVDGGHIIEPPFDQDVRDHSSDESSHHSFNDEDENRPFTLLELMAIE